MTKPSADFVGREKELATLVAAVSRRPAVVVVEGEAGVGKSRLLAELRAYPKLGGTRLVTGACRRIGDPFPLGPILDGLRDHRDALRDVRISPVAGVLRSLLPELGDVLPAAPAPLADQLADRHRLFRALREVFDALGPVLLCVEDLQCADEQTVEFLGALVSDPPRRLALAVTYRDDEIGAVARSITAGLPWAVDREYVDLTPLDVADTRELAESILGSGEVSTELATYLWEQTGGLPLAVEELLVTMREQDALSRQAGSWVRRSLDRTVVPIRIRDAVLARVDRLSSTARTVIDAAAVLQTSQPAAVLAAMCCRDEEEVLNGLAEAYALGIVVDDEAGVGFRHLMAAQAVYGAVPGPRRQLLHGRAADALHDVAVPPLDQIAHHLRCAGRCAEWVAMAEWAADQAVANRDEAQACRHLDDLLRHAPLGAEARVRVALKLGWAALTGEIHVDATAPLIDALDRGAPVDLRGELRCVLALSMKRAGSDPATWRRHAVQAIDELEHRPDLQARTMVALGTPGWLRRAMELVPSLDEPSLRINIWGEIAGTLVMMGDPSWRGLVERVLEETGGTACGRQEVAGYMSIGLGACLAGRLELAGQMAEAAGVRTSGSELLCDFLSGRWGGLEDRAGSDSLTGCLALARGDLDTAETQLMAALARLEATNDYALLPVPGAALIRLLTSRDRASDAAAIGLRVISGADGSGVWAPALRLLPPLVAALMGAGRVEQARDVVRRVTDAVDALDVPLAAATIPHALGLLSMAEHGWDAAASFLCSAVDSYQALSCRYEAAQAAEEAARCLDQLCDHQQAEERVRATLAAYESLGAEWDAARALHLARQLGVSVPGRHRGGRRGYGSELSPREQEVAELVSLGRTNAEIAQDLYLSPRTVERHVGAAKRKLGASTRTALAHVLTSTSVVEA